MRVSVTSDTMTLRSPIESVAPRLRVAAGVCVVLWCVATAGEAQFRNDRDQEYNRDQEYYYYQSRRDQPPPYSTPPSLRSQYNSGDTYYGTDRRYDTRYDDPTRLRGFDNRYQNSRYGEDNYQDQLGNRRYDSRGRERPGYEGRQWDARYSGQFGVLDGWRPDLQGELRPSEKPGMSADPEIPHSNFQSPYLYQYSYKSPIG